MSRPFSHTAALHRTRKANKPLRLRARYFARVLRKPFRRSNPWLPFAPSGAQARCARTSHLLVLELCSWWNIAPRGFASDFVVVPTVNSREAAKNAKYCRRSLTRRRLPPGAGLGFMRYEVPGRILYMEVNFKRYGLYLVRWHLSTPILAGTLLSRFGGLGALAATVVANLIGGLIFFWVDRFIFTS